MTKKELRKIYLDRRYSLSQDEYNRLNSQLSTNFFSAVDLSIVTTLHTFLPIEKNMEPDTWQVITGIRSHHPHIHISIPRVNDSTGMLENILFENTEQLRTNKWGIPEPYTGSTVPVQEIDMVLVPMIIFDRLGQRVGYGKGYYDKFLSMCRKNCQRIGISLFEPVERIDDINKFDVPLNYCLTPINFYHF